MNNAWVSTKQWQHKPHWFTGMLNKLILVLPTTQHSMDPTQGRDMHTGSNFGVVLRWLANSVLV